MKLRRRIQKARGVYLLPNLLTTLNLLAGFYSLVSVLEWRFTQAAWAILLALVFDNLDGRIARFTRSTSRFGAEYDSLADLVSFGIAPGILIYMWALQAFGKVGWLAAVLYVATAALRLARFNVQVIEGGRFNGLPSPAAGGLIASTVLFYNYVGIGDVGRSVMILSLTFFLALVMVSNLKYHGFKEADLFKRRPFHTLFIAVLILILVAAEPIILLFTMFYVYLISGIAETAINLAMRLVTRRVSKTAPDLTAPPKGGQAGK